jgi:hypothetical protein
MAIADARPCPWASIPGFPQTWATRGIELVVVTQRPKKSGACRSRQTPFDYSPRSTRTIQSDPTGNFRLTRMNRPFVLPASKANTATGVSFLRCA